MNHSGSMEDYAPLNGVFRSDTGTGGAPGIVTTADDAQALAGTATASSKQRPLQDSNCDDDNHHHHPLPHQVADLVQRLLSLFHRQGEYYSLDHVNDYSSSFPQHHHRSNNHFGAEYQSECALSLPLAAMQFLGRHLEVTKPYSSSRRDTSSRTHVARNRNDREWSLIRQGLARVTRLRITNEPWPKPEPVHHPQHTVFRRVP
jgi:hypothetical protein